MTRSLLVMVMVIATLLAACGTTPSAPPAEAPAEETEEEGTTGDAASEDEGTEADEEAPAEDDTTADDAASDEEADEESSDSEVYLPGVSQGDTVTETEAQEVPAGPVGDAASDADCASPDVLCVGLVTDVGHVDDRSFNQSAWEALQQAEEELGAVVSYIETTDANDYADNIALFAEQGYDTIVTVGFAIGQATVEAAAEYPDVDFIGVDQFQIEPIDNIAGLVFEEDKSGFLAGALAAQMSESGIIAAVLGTDLVPPVVAFKEGYESGAEYINPAITIISTYHPGGLDVAFLDPEWGATTARQALDQGADVIFGAGGITGNGALIETAGAEDAYCIGVDTDQWETLPEAHPCLISSAVKLITPGVYNLIELEMQGEFPAGNYFGEVGLASFHDFESEIPPEVIDRLNEIEAGLIDGSIETGYEPGV